MVRRQKTKRKKAEDPSAFAHEAADRGSARRAACEGSPLKRPWADRQRDAPDLHRRPSPTREEVGDLLGFFHGSRARPPSRRQRDGGTQQQEVQQRTGGCVAVDGLEEEGDSKYWRRDGQGRPFRLPFKATERDMQRARELDRCIADFVRDNGLEDRVGRIMKNMLPDDVRRVLDEGGVPNNCANPNAVVVARIRRVEKAMERPNAMKRYDQDTTRSASPCAVQRSRRSGHRRCRAAALERGRGSSPPRSRPRRRRSRRRRAAHACSRRIRSCSSSSESRSEWSDW